MKYDTIPVFNTYEQHMRIFTLTRTQMHDFQPVDSLVRKEMEMEYTHFLSLIRYHANRLRPQSPSKYTYIPLAWWNSSIGVSEMYVCVCVDISTRIHSTTTPIKSNCVCWLCFPFYYYTSYSLLSLVYANGKIRERKKEGTRKI